jgi:hypothetical protein
MSLDPLTTIRKVEQFLLEQVSNAVAPEMRSDVKAAAKLLNESVREIDELALRLHKESQSMLDLCQQANLQLGISFVVDVEHQVDLSSWADMALTGQISLHQKILNQFDHMQIALVDKINKLLKPSANLEQLLSECIAVQSQMAQQRLPFQSVFKPD